jgi:cytochrome oxidase Cu insertion factor (SCO1/SenC/PrrC family)
MPGSRSSNPSAAARADAEPLTLSVHGIAAPDLDDSDLAARNRTKQGRIRMLLVLAVCAAPVIASYLTYFVIRPTSHSSYGQLIVPTRSVPDDLAMTRLDGTPVTARNLHGQWLLVTVGPSTCDAACDKRLFAQRQFREMLGRERDRVDKIWLITDNAPLTPALAAAIAAKPEVTALRVDPAALARWLGPAEGQALAEHLYVVDPMGEFMMRLPSQPDPGKTKRDLERLLRASASWDTPGR